MTLLEAQRVFRVEITASDDDNTQTSTGMAIYRDAYRGRLLTALEVSFERTRRWVGEQPFTGAACHYILTNPPRGWTLDDYGASFPEQLAGLFGDDPEVAELAWLEWHMQRAFAALDAPELTAEVLAAVGYRDQDWARVCFVPATSFVMRRVSTNCTDLWESLTGPEIPCEWVKHDPDAYLVVWRRDVSPHYRIIDPEEARALELLTNGATFGDVAAITPPEALGPRLARWLSDGLFSETFLAEVAR